MEQNMKKRAKEITDKLNNTRKRLKTVKDQIEPIQTLLDQLTNKKKKIINRISDYKDRLKEIQDFLESPFRKLLSEVLNSELADLCLEYLPMLSWCCECKKPVYTYYCIRCQTVKDRIDDSYCFNGPVEIYYSNRWYLHVNNPVDRYSIKQLHTHVYLTEKDTRITISEKLIAYLRLKYTLLYGSRLTLDVPVRLSFVISHDDCEIDGDRCNGTYSKDNDCTPFHYFELCLEEEFKDDDKNIG